MPTCRELEEVLFGPIGDEIFSKILEIEGGAQIGTTRFTDWAVAGIQEPECFMSPPRKELMRRVEKRLPLEAEFAVMDTNVAFFVFARMEAIPSGIWSSRVLSELGGRIEREIHDLFWGLMDPQPSEMGLMPFGFFDSTVPRVPPTPIPGPPPPEQLRKVQGALRANEANLPGALFRAFLRWPAPTPMMNGPWRRR